ncbi:uncharacterized protein LOC125228065 isoform X2 [Leguminivora glycinivorella]|uniref:uncharacterized protein LOC125228065 isoform X2 n=1 Tax=Leguminivora glycinivorella TaxID=1035111 RepID=UPI002010BD49|nr:uncharacterized protein LOC125228065 isoform X2 [Leguminivora glycinivorella]
MSRLGCLLLIWTICQAVLANEDNEKGFVQPLDFSPIFAGDNSGPPRLRRYTGEHKRQNLRKRSEDDEEDDPYDYKSEYISRPKAFDGGAYSSAYKEEKDPNKDYEYPYGYDSGYDHKEYERIKELSEKQAAEIKQNPGNCKQVNRDGMTCNVCKDPKTGGNYESCSYVAEPKNNKYAYSKEKKFNSNDEPDEPEGQKEEAPSKSAKYEEAKEDDKPSEEYSKLKAPKEESEEDDSKEKYKAYYVHSSQPTPSEKLRAASDESSEEKSDTLVKPYNYKQALPEFYTDNEPKKDVEHVLAEFKKKDRSSCNQVNKNGMTCFQCVDKNGLKNEECMFVSESAPKKSHLAYQELKEFQSQPPAPPVAATSEGAESKVVAANASPAQKTAAYVVANTGYGKKLKRKKASQATPTAAATSPVAAVASAVPAAAAAAPLPAAARRLRRSVDAEAEDRAEIADETELGPEEFAGAESKAAYWAETMPRYSAALGVTLPEFMLARSEHEASFDEIVAGA